MTITDIGEATALRQPPTPTSEPHVGDLPTQLAHQSPTRTGPSGSGRSGGMLRSVLNFVALPAPLVDHPRPAHATSHDSAAAHGVRMRRRSDPNP